MNPPLYIKIRRSCEANAPFNLFLDAGNDWTHFVHLHRKSHAEYRLICKTGNKEVFFYKSYLLYPLPFYSKYLAVREYIPEQFSYRQVYYDLKNGHVHYLDSRNIQKENTVIGIADFWFSVSPLWRFFPNLFFWIFKRRMNCLMREDNEMIKDRIQNGGATAAACAPAIQDAFGFYDEQIKKWPPKAEFEFETYGYEDLFKK